LAVDTFSTDHFSSRVIPEGINSQAHKMFAL